MWVSIASLSHKQINQQFARFLRLFPVNSPLEETDYKPEKIASQIRIQLSWQAFIERMKQYITASRKQTATGAMEPRSSSPSNAFDGLRWSTCAQWMVLLRCTMLCTATQLVCTRPTFSIIFMEFMKVYHSWLMKVLAQIECPFGTMNAAKSNQQLGTIFEHFRF